MQIQARPDSTGLPNTLRGLANRTFYRVVTRTCPYCHRAAYSWRELVTFSITGLALCSGCGEWAHNPRPRQAAGIVLGVSLAIGAVLALSWRFDGKLHPLFSLPFSLLIWFGLAVLAKPSAPSGPPRVCSVCQRHDVGYYAWESKNCAVCIEAMEETRGQKARSDVDRK